MFEYNFVPSRKHARARHIVSSWWSSPRYTLESNWCTIPKAHLELDFNLYQSLYHAYMHIVTACMDWTVEDCESSHIWDMDERESIVGTRK